MTDPKLARASSGLGGRGYRNPVTGEVVPSVTTVLGAIDKPALRQWVADQTAAYAVANVDALLNRDEVQGYGFLRFFWNRFKEKDFDNPHIDIRDYANGVLNDAAELGTLTHEWIEADLNDWFEPDLVRDEQAQMIAEYLSWKVGQEIEIFATEATVFGDGYAGTADWFGRVNGRALLVDNKTSRNTWDEHLAQLAALGAADTWMREVPKGTAGAHKHERTRRGVKETSWWVPEPLPPVEGYAILHLRPDDYNNKGEFVPAFCTLKEVPQEEIDAAWGMFTGSLTVRRSQYTIKELRKARGEKEEDDGGE